MRFGSGLKCAAAALAVTLAAPAYAQEDGTAELDALLDASASPEAAIALAGRQEGEGDLTGAAATLERALIADPKSTAVRLRYVALLCRLDDRQRAAIELAKTGQPAPEACGGLAPVASGKRSDGWRGQVSAGLAYDSDANGALALRFGVPGLVYPREDGVAVVAAASLKGRAGIGGNGFVYGSGSAQIRNDISGPDYDYQVGDLSLGFGIRGRTLEASIGGVARHGIVQGFSYLTELGGEAQLAFPLGNDARITLRGELVDQAFLDVPLLSRDGTRYDIALDYQGGSDEGLSYLVGGGLERKTADTNYLAYRGFRLFVAARMPLGGGAYAVAGGTVRHIDYYDDPTTRDYVEDRYYGRLGVGVPLGGGLFAEGALTSTWRDYNANSFLRDYHSTGGELRLVFKFGE